MPKSHTSSLYLTTTNIQKLDLQQYNEKRKQKYQLKPVLKQLDLDKSGQINYEVFHTVAQDNDIHLSDKDKLYLKSKVHNHKLNYEEVIKDLALVVIHQKFLNESDNKERVKEKENKGIEDGQGKESGKVVMQWVLRSNNREIVTQMQGDQGTLKNLIRVKKRKPAMNLQNRLDLLSSKHTSTPVNLGSLRSMTSLSQNAEAKNYSTLDANASSSNNELTTLLQTFSPDLQNVVKKIIGSKTTQKKIGNTDWKNQISAASKKINIPKNIQNKIFIKAAISSDKIQQQKDRIRRYMKENNVDIMHLNAINSVFLDCDEERTGQITKKQFLIQIAEQNLQFPFDFLFNLIGDMLLNADDQSEDAILSYENLKNITEIYNNCPTFLRGDANNSDNFRSNMDTNKDFTGSQDRVDKLFQYVHARIEEKFKDFRQAFRNFDKNFDGGINFKEFITGMESIGVKLKLTDYRLIFDHVDYDGEGEIGFSKFCLLNTDRRSDLNNLKMEHLKSLDQRSFKSSKQGGKKPPLPPLLSVTGTSHDTHKGGHPLFGDGNIPKNKDMNSFTQAIQDKSAVRNYMEKRFLRTAHSHGFKTPQDVPENFAFGKSNPSNHNMVALLTNSYQDDLKRVSLESLRQQLSQKRIPQPKPTYAQMIRDKLVKNKYQSLSQEGRRTSVSIQRSNSAHKRIRRQDFILKGSSPLIKTQHSNSFSQLDQTK